MEEEQEIKGGCRTLYKWLYPPPIIVRLVISRSMG
jgi:hypothetical protein